MDEPVEIKSFRDEFYPSGGRKVIAMLLIIAVTGFPALRQWETYAEYETTSRIWEVLRTAFTMFVVTASLMLYYPSWGYKRYALLSGPMIALCIPWAVSSYLQGRTTVYRTEVAIVTLVAALPGAALYGYLCWRKARRRGMEW